MKRVGNLMPMIADRENLREAFLLAVRGKQSKAECGLRLALQLSPCSNGKNRECLLAGGVQSMVKIGESDGMDFRHKGWLSVGCLFIGFSKRAIHLMDSCYL